MSDLTLLLNALNAQLIGKPAATELAVICLLAEGHLLIEDMPGTGKTTLARALAGATGGVAARIQFTPDLLPTDVTGVNIWNQGTAEFEFHHGPVFGNVLLADEINRASPKTQSALLEVMEERQVTVDGKTWPIPRPFSVVATQNPFEMEGTYRLPEAQLDRFLIRTSLGYLDPESELAVITGRAHAAHGEHGITSAQTRGLVAQAARTEVNDVLGAYIVRLAALTRQHEGVRLGVSTRGALALVRSVRARAVIHQRSYATADDVHALAEPVWAHRLLLTPEAELRGLNAAEVITDVLRTLPTPDSDAVRTYSRA